KSRRRVLRFPTAQAAHSATLLHPQAPAGLSRAVAARPGRRTFLHHRVRPVRRACENSEFVPQLRIFLATFGLSSNTHKKMPYVFF
ncbi:MAG: hypothetical protein AAF585_18190, partial [Verrucomicrobiota bacterium]